MAHLLIAIPYRNLLVRATLGVLAVFLFFSIATGALPVQCLTSGTMFCKGGARAEMAVPSMSWAPHIAAPAMPQIVKTAAIEEPPAPTLSRNELIAQTFGVLKLGFSSTQAPVQPTTRLVSTTTIRASAAPAGNWAPANPPPLLVAEVSEPAAAEPPAPPAPKAKPAKSASASTATVLGNGANARASASSKAKVLFALSGGTAVTILESSHGWLHVRDGKGHDGWMYKDFVRQG